MFRFVFYALTVTIYLLLASAPSQGKSGKDAPDAVEIASEGRPWPCPPVCPP